MGKILFSILLGGVHARVFSMSDHRWQKEEKSGLVGDNVEILKAEARQTSKSSTVKDMWVIELQASKSGVSTRTWTLNPTERASCQPGSTKPVKAST